MNLVDIVSQYVRLKRQGQNRYVGLCPFHKEKTPSFTVNTDLQIYKCFGCDAGGDVFAFLREVEHVSFPEALRICASIAGVSVDERQKENGPARPSHSADLVAEAELWRIGLIWRIERALASAKAVLWTERHKDAIRTTRRLTKQLAAVQQWTPRECVDQARAMNPLLVRECVDEAREFETLLATILAGAGMSHELKVAA